MRHSVPHMSSVIGLILIQQLAEGDREIHATRMLGTEEVMECEQTGTVLGHQCTSFP